MSKVSYPDTNNVGNNYPYNYDSVGGENDPRSSQGLGGSGYDVQGYISYMHQYQQMLLSYKRTHANDPRALATVDNFLALSQKYLASVGDYGWDPMMGDGFGGSGMGGFDLGTNAGMGVPSQAEGTLSTLPASSYQDTTQVMWDDDVKEIVATKTDFPGREKKFYGYEEATLNLKGSAHATVTYEKDVKTGKMVTVVRVKWDSDGAEQKYVYANAKKVNVIAGSPDEQVTIDASVPAEKVEKKGAGEKEEKASVKGDAPTGEKDGKEEWDLPNATIYPSGDGKEKNVFVSENLTFKAASTRDYWTVEWDAAKKVYVVKVYEDSAKTKMKNTYVVDEMVDKIFFGKDIEANHIEFLGTLADPSDSHKPNSSTPEGQKIFVGTDSATAALNETKKVEYPDGLKSLLEGKKDQEILDALKAAGYMALKTIEDFRKAVADGEFLTSLPEKKLIKFLAQFDGDFKSALNKASFSQTFDEKQTNLQKAAECLNELLGKLYPESKISDPAGYASGNESTINLMFDGQSVSVDMTKSNYMEVTVSPPWPKESEILAHLPNAGSHDWTVDLTSFIMKGVSAHNSSSPLWNDVTTFLNRDASHVNDAIRGLMSGIYITAGSDEKKFKGLLKMIPANVRQHMVNILRSHEKFEKSGDEQWDSTTTAALIQETI